MSKKKLLTRPTSKDWRYPAFWDFSRSDNYDIFQGKFYSDLDHRTDMLTKPRRWMEDKWRKKLLNFLWYEVEEKDEKIGVSLLYAHLFGIYHTLIKLIGKENGKEKIRLLKKRLDFHRKIWSNPIPQLEYFLWLSMTYEVSLYIYEDTIDIDCMVEQNSNRFLGTYNELPYIKIPLHTQREWLIKERDNVWRPNLFLLNDKEKELLVEIMDNQTDEGIWINAVIKKGEFIWIDSIRRAKKEELESLWKIWEKHHFATLEDVKIVHWNTVSGNIRKEIRFDKTKYMDIQ